MAAAIRLSQQHSCSLDRTDGVIREAIGEILKHPAALDATAFVGFDGATFTNAPNTGAIFFTLKSFEERARRGFPAARIVADLRRQLSASRMLLSSSSSRPRSLALARGAD